MDYRYALANVHADQLQTVRAQLARAQELPSNSWKGYLERAAEELQHALAAEHKLTELEKANPDTTEDALLGTFRDLSAGFASALIAWPEIREASASVSQALHDGDALTA